MNNIGNIITDIIIDVDRFNVLSDYTQRDINLPTLIVGYTKLMTLFPDYTIKYKDNKVSDNIYWTYSRSEKRGLYQQELYNFKQSSYQKLFNDFNYYFVDFIVLTNNKLLKIINKIKTSKNIIFCEYDKGFFILYNNTVLGFNNINIEYSGNKIETLKEHMLTSNNLINCNISNYDNEQMFFDDNYLITILCGFDNNFFPKM